MDSPLHQLGAAYIEHPSALDQGGHVGVAIPHHDEHSAHHVRDIFHTDEAGFQGVRASGWESNHVTL
jgi:hypothetical protein